MYLFTFTVQFLFLLLTNIHAKEREIINMPQLPGSSERLVYISELLDAALQKTVKEYGNYEIQVSRKASTDEKISSDLASGEFNYSLGWVSINKPISEQLLYIPIPLYRGVLGARIFHIKDSFKKVLNIKTLEDLKKVPIGVGENWGDDEIMKHSNLNIVLGKSHSDLTGMLSEEKIKLITRSIYEAYSEIPDILKVYKDISVESNILLYYKSDLFLAFPQKNKNLKDRLEKGLNILLSTGEFQNIFNKYFKKNIDAAKISTRTVFTIDAPYVIPGDYLLDKKLWISLEREVK
jgi:ABC-type amino acid transport substrate-binding protein